MARRKDHTSDELKRLILQSAEKLIHAKGLNNLTARALAKAIGYTPGTIYNFYRDMDAVVGDINYTTLGRLHAFCEERMKKRPADFSRVRALAYAYVDFAHDNVRAWETLYSNTRKGDRKTRLPQHYQDRLVELFDLIEKTLQECLKVPVVHSRATARLLWACLHGITVLTLDGRLSLAGVERPHDMIDNLLANYLAAYLKS